jgi:hypothetical protein
LGQYKIRVTASRPAPSRSSAPSTKQATTQVRGPNSRRWAASDSRGCRQCCRVSGQRCREFVSGQTIWVDGGLFSKPAWPYE